MDVSAGPAALIDLHAEITAYPRTQRVLAAVDADALSGTSVQGGFTRQPSAGAAAARV
jgi:hypothetical protein